MIATRTRWWSIDTTARSERPPATDDDADLVARAQGEGEGAAIAFGLLYDRYVDAVYRYCARRLENDAMAEDTTSLVFTRALAALPRFDLGGHSFRAWLFTIAQNAVLDTLRSASHRLNRPLDVALDVSDTAPAPDDLAVVAEQRASVNTALRLLPADQRQIVELRLAGLSGLEIAAATGRSHAAVRTAQHRAITRLRGLLGVTIDEETGNG